MIISFCDIKLCRLEKNNIEMLRNWRNDAKISNHMFFQDYITPEMQDVWFENLHLTKDFYFLIQFQQKYIGLIHLHKIDSKNLQAEAGLFIYDENYWGTHVPLQASLALLQFAFKNKKLEKVIAKVRNENTAAKKYNSFLGFQQIDNFYFELTKENYQSITKKLMVKMQKISKL
jgi:RimJ/RimL family protein N-acetyltransferase